MSNMSGTHMNLNPPIKIRKLVSVAAYRYTTNVKSSITTEVIADETVRARLGYFRQRNDVIAKIVIYGRISHR